MTCGGGGGGGVGVEMVEGGVWVGVAVVERRALDAALDAQLVGHEEGVGQPGARRAAVHGHRLRQLAQLDHGRVDRVQARGVCGGRGAPVVSSLLHTAGTCGVEAHICCPGIPS